MWLFLSLFNRSLFHAFITGVLFVGLSLSIGFKQELFTLLVLVFVSIAEYWDHKTKNFNFPGDRYSAVRDLTVSFLSFLVTLVFLLFESKLGFEYRIVSLVSLPIPGLISIFIFDHISNVRKGRHWETKHLIDIAASVSGPYLISPIFFKLMS